MCQKELQELNGSGGIQCRNDIGQRPFVANNKYLKKMCTLQKMCRQHDFIWICLISMPKIVIMQSLRMANKF